VPLIIDRSQTNSFATHTWKVEVSYSCDNLFQPTVNSRASDNRSKQCQNRISQLGKMHSYVKCRHIYRCLWRGLGGGGGTFWLLYCLAFKGPEASQATAVNRTGVNKIAPNFDTQFATYI